MKHTTVNTLASSSSSSSSVASILVEHSRVQDSAPGDAILSHVEMWCELFFNSPQAGFWSVTWSFKSLVRLNIKNWPAKIWNS